MYKTKREENMAKGLATIKVLMQVGEKTRNLPCTNAAYDRAAGLDLLGMLGTHDFNKRRGLCFHLRWKPKHRFDLSKVDW